MAICNARAGVMVALEERESQMAKGVHHLLISGFFKRVGHVFVAHVAGQLGEIAVAAISASAR